MADIKIIQGFYQREIENEKKKLSFLDIPEKREAHIGSFGGINVFFALHAMYVEQVFVKARNCFYKAAVSAEYMLKMYGWELQTGMHKICYALLSDNTKVLERYKTIKDKNPDYEFIGYQFVTGVQSILQNNNDELEKQIAALKESTNMKGREGYEGFVKVFEGFFNQDNTHLEIGLNELIMTHKKREKIALVSDYFSIKTAALAKLAWRKGFEINFESSFVPKEMLPINELPGYLGYDFFQEIGY